VCLNSVRSVLPDVPLIASGGMKTGLDGAKAIAIGADLVGFARTLLKVATESVEAVLDVMEQIEFELKVAMFGIGARDIQALKETNRLMINNRPIAEDL